MCTDQVPSLFVIWVDFLWEKQVQAPLLRLLALRADSLWALSLFSVFQALALCHSCTLLIVSDHPIKENCPPDRPSHWFRLLLSLECPPSLATFGLIIRCSAFFETPWILTWLAKILLKVWPRCTWRKQRLNQSSRLSLWHVGWTMRSPETEKWTAIWKNVKSSQIKVYLYNLRQTKCCTVKK